MSSSTIRNRTILKNYDNAIFLPTNDNLICIYTRLLVKTFVKQIKHMRESAQTTLEETGLVQLLKAQLLIGFH